MFTCRVYFFSYELNVGIHGLVSLFGFWPLWYPFLGAISILERLAVGDRNCKYFSQLDVCFGLWVYLGIIFVQSNNVLSASI